MVGMWSVSRSGKAQKASLFPTSSSLTQASPSGPGARGSSKTPSPDNQKKKKTRSESSRLPSSRTLGRAQAKNGSRGRKGSAAAEPTLPRSGSPVRKTPAREQRTQDLFPVPDKKVPELEADVTPVVAAANSGASSPRAPSHASPSSSASSSAPCRLSVDSPPSKEAPGSLSPSVSISRTLARRNTVTGSSNEMTNEGKAGEEEGKEGEADFTGSPRFSPPTTPSASLPGEPLSPTLWTRAVYLGSPEIHEASSKGDQEAKLSREPGQTGVNDDSDSESSSEAQTLRKLLEDAKSELEQAQAKHKEVVAGLMSQLAAANAALWEKQVSASEESQGKWALVEAEKEACEEENESLKEKNAALVKELERVHGAKKEEVSGFGLGYFLNLSG